MPKFSGLRVFSGALAAFLLLACVMPQAGGAADLSAGCSKPFPALMPLDYALCRASAWLDALEKAENRLPPFLEARLWESGLTDRLARLSVAGLLFPVSAVTPDISSSPEIMVFLHPPQNVANALASAMNNPEKIFLMMVFVRESIAKVEAMRKAWPESIAEAEAKMNFLEKTSRDLDAIWQAMMEIAHNDASSSLMVDPVWAASEGVDSIPFRLADIQKNLANQRSQDALKLADEAMRGCEALKAENNQSLWRFFMAYALYLRGMAHFRQDQLALAEHDLREASSLLEATGLRFEVLARVSLALAGLYNARGETDFMCAQLEKACSYGLCAELAAQRRASICLESNRP